METFCEDAASGLKPALFLHIQKTAGTSIVELAARYYGNHNVTSHAGYIGKPPREFSKTPFVSGHFGYDYAKSLMPSRYTFTFLRDPRERILSYYYFCRQRDTSEFESYRLAKELPLHKFLELGLPGGPLQTLMWNNQCWQLAHGYNGDPAMSIDTADPDQLLQLAISHLPTFSHIGFTSMFRKDTKVIARNLGIPDPLPAIKTNVTEGAVYTRLPPATEALLNRLTELDRKVYRYAWSQRNSKSKLLTKLRRHFRRSE